MISTDKFILLLGATLLFPTSLLAQEGTDLSPVGQRSIAARSSKNQKGRLPTRRGSSFKRSIQKKSLEKPIPKTISREEMDEAIERAMFVEKKGLFFSSYIRGTTSFQGFSLTPATFRLPGIDDYHTLGNDEGSSFSMTIGMNHSIARNLWVGAEFGFSYNVSGYYGLPVIFIPQVNPDSGLQISKSFVSFGKKNSKLSVWLGLKDLYNQDIPTMNMRLRSLCGTGTGVQDISLSKRNSVLLDFSFLTAANSLAGGVFDNKQTLFLLDYHFKNISVSNSSSKLGVQVTPMIVMNVDWQPDPNTLEKTALPDELSKRIGLQLALSYEQDFFWFFQRGSTFGNFLLQAGYGPGMKFSAPYPYAYIKSTNPPRDENPQGGMQSLDSFPIHLRCFYYGMFDVHEDINVHLVTGAAFINGRKGAPKVWSTTSVRPIFHLSHMFHIQTEYALDIVAYTSNPGSANTSESPLVLNKLTIAPGLKFPGNLRGNPTISMFGTFGVWNNPSIQQPPPPAVPIVAPLSENYAFSWGFQIEAAL